MRLPGSPNNLLTAWGRDSAGLASGCLPVMRVQLATRTHVPRNRSKCMQGNQIYIYLSHSMWINLEHAYFICLTYLTCVL